MTIPARLKRGLHLAGVRVLSRQVCLLVLSFHLPIASAAAQGFIAFNNRVPKILVAPVYESDPLGEMLAKTGNTPAGLPAGRGAAFMPLHFGPRLGGRTGQGSVGVEAA